MSVVDRKLLVIAGPTASGKTDFALDLAPSLPLRLISADSMQVYIGMDIGTAKPSRSQREQFALMDVIEPGASYSAGRFVRDATIICEATWKAGQVPCLVGGSGLYIRSLLNGLSELPPIPSDVRAEVESMSLESRTEALAKVDPETLAAIDQSNPRRVARALEIHMATGKGLKAWQRESVPQPLRVGQSLGLCLSLSIDESHARIHERSQKALSEGWLEEARQLALRYGAEAVRATGAIGYGELLDVLDGKQELGEASRQIEARTRQYARRQRTWFRKEAGLKWSSDFSGMKKEIHDFVKGEHV